MVEQLLLVDSPFGHLLEHYFDAIVDRGHPAEELDDGVGTCTCVRETSCAKVEKIDEQVDD